MGKMFKNESSIKDIKEWSGKWERRSNSYVLFGYEKDKPLIYILWSVENFPNPFSIYSPRTNESFGYYNPEELKNWFKENGIGNTPDWNEIKDIYKQIQKEQKK